jgi:polysaccharide export outer membrane protein
MMRVWLALFLVAGQLYAADTALHDRHRPYRLQPGDQLQLSYRYSPEYDQTLTVQPDGMVSIDLVGEVPLAGRTLSDARSALLTALSARLNNPEITLTLTDFVRPTFTVVGEVGSPGRFELRGSVTAVEAIAIAGGLKSSAKHSDVILFRRVDGDMASTHILDLKKLMNYKHPHLEEDMVLQPGDLLVVPKNRVSKLADYVHWVSVGSYFPM